MAHRNVSEVSVYWGKEPLNVTGYHYCSSWVNLSINKTKALIVLLFMYARMQVAFSKNGLCVQRWFCPLFCDAGSVIQWVSIISLNSSFDPDLPSFRHQEVRKVTECTHYNCWCCCEWQLAFRKYVLIFWIIKTSWAHTVCWLILYRKNVCGQLGASSTSGNWLTDYGISFVRRWGL